MCGIFGIVNGKHFRGNNQNISKLVIDGIMTNSVRGSDSTGIMQLDSKNSYFFKAPVNGANFVKLAESQAYINDTDNAHFTVIHNRAATEGKISTDNAHPFDHVGTRNNYVIGVHNGTLRNWKPKDSKFEVDSDWAISEIADKGIEALKSFVGAFVFVWYDDAEPGVLQFARNAERPMFVLFIKGQNRMVFASEYQMVTWLADRNNLSLEAEVVELAANYHYKFKLDNPKEFTKQYFSSNSTGNVVTGTMSTPAQIPLTEKERFTQKMQGLFPAARAPVVMGTPPPAGPPVPEPEPYVTKEERQLATANLMFREEAEFHIEHYDEKSRILWGSIIDNVGDVCCAVIRKVDKSQYQTWERATSLAGKVWGAFEHQMEGTNNLVYILGRGVRMDDVDEHPMADAIRKSLAKFEQDKKNEQDATRATKH